MRFFLENRKPGCIFPCSSQQGNAYFTHEGAVQTTGADVTAAEQRAKAEKAKADAPKAAKALAAVQKVRCLL